MKMTAIEDKNVMRKDNKIRRERNIRRKQASSGHRKHIICIKVCMYLCVCACACTHVLVTVLSSNSIHITKKNIKFFFCRTRVPDTITREHLMLLNLTHIWKQINKKTSIILSTISWSPYILFVLHKIDKGLNSKLNS